MPARWRPGQFGSSLLFLKLSSLSFGHFRLGLVTAIRLFRSILIIVIVHLGKDIWVAAASALNNRSRHHHYLLSLLHNTLKYSRWSRVVLDFRIAHLGRPQNLITNSSLLSLLSRTKCKAYPIQKTDPAGGSFRCTRPHAPFSDGRCAGRPTSSKNVFWWMRMFAPVVGGKSRYAKYVCLQQQ